MLEKSEDTLRETVGEETPRAKVEAAQCLVQLHGIYNLSPAVVALAGSLWQLLAPSGMAPLPH